MIVICVPFEIVYWILLKIQTIHTRLLNLHLYLIWLYFMDSCGKLMSKKKINPLDDQIQVNSEIYLSSNGLIHFLVQEQCKIFFFLINIWFKCFYMINFYRSFADSVYEAANISVNLGLWLMKHAAMIASKNEYEKLKHFT